MGNACCNYQPKDANDKNFRQDALKKQGGKAININNADLVKAYAAGKKNEGQVIKIQAFARGYLARKMHGCKRKRVERSDLE